MYWEGADTVLRPGLDARFYEKQVKKYDTAMMGKVVDHLGANPVPRLMTLYFAGLDHEAHAERGDVNEKQLAYLPHIDKELVRLKDVLHNKKALDRAVFVVTADHGHTDVRNVLEASDDAHTIGVEDVLEDEELE